MKKVVSSVIAFGILLQAASLLAIFIGFSLNQKYISQNLCENRYKPKMHCHGHCHLMKQLKKQQNDEKEAPSSQKQDDAGPLYYQHSPMQGLAPSGIIIPANKSLYIARNYSAPLHASFHPPKQA